MGALSFSLLIAASFLSGWICSAEAGRNVHIIYRWRKPRPRRIGFLIGGRRMKEMNLKVSQKVSVAVLAEDKFGNPTGAFDAAPVWSLVDPTLGVVTAAADGLSAELVPTGKLGETQLQVLGSADGKQLSGHLDLVLIAGDAVQLVLQAGAPVDA